MDRHLAITETVVRQWALHIATVHSIIHRADHLVNNLLLALIQWTMMMNLHDEAEEEEELAAEHVVEEGVAIEEEGVAEAVLR